MAGIACSVAVASLSYWALERPLLQLKRLVPTSRPVPGEPKSPEPGPMGLEKAVATRGGDPG